ncbi:MAG: hypothetical protein ACXVJL_08405 [Candidatus Angelobacter sp.]
MENQGTVMKASSFWPILRGITFILASLGFIAFLSGFLHGENWGMGLPLFVVGTVALVAMTPTPDALPALEGERTGKLAQRRMPWSLIAHCVITGIGFNWMCVFLAFSRQYAFFSPPVVGATACIMALYATSGLLVARLTGKNWRIGLVVFALASCALGAIVLRLNLFPVR